MSYSTFVADFHRPIESVVFLRERSRRVNECKCLRNAATIHPPDDPLELQSTAEDNRDTGEMNVVGLKAKVQFVLY